MTENRKRLFVVLGAAAGLILAFLLVYLFVLDRPNSAPAPTTSEVAPTSTAETIVTTPVRGIATSPTAPVVREPGVPDDIYLEQLARLFVERATSFSNQNNNRHLTDIEAIATPRVLSFIRSQAPAESDTFAGTTTNVIVSTLQQKTDTTAAVEIAVQQETGGFTSPTVSYKNGRVDLVFINGQWKVDGLFWE